MMSGENNDENQVGELECRVCRMGAEDDRPLYTPCQCSGSIGSVHQDCLEAWLKHSKKDSCELCGIKYQFEAQYHPDAPDKIPVAALLKSMIRMSTFSTIPFLLKTLCAIVVWIVFIPVLTVWAYSFCMGRGRTFMEVTKFETIFSYIRYGIVIDITIVVTMLVLVSILFQLVGCFYILD
jgi:E3 ubiquitin-protein ligase MARCH6